MQQPVSAHSPTDDAQALAFGSFMAAVGVLLLSHMSFVTGQTAGLALLISYATGWGFGPVFFVVNLPFYWFGWKRFGPAFVVKSLIAVSILSVLAAILPQYLQFGAIHPAVGAVLAGAIVGTALLSLFRHGASLGGVGIVGLYIQDATGFRAGWVQLGFDAVIFGLALTFIDWRTVAWSALGALIANLVIAINHRRDRYLA
ncbi:MAG: YitT family protein [Paracoccus sp. (in: a-proteobacteria)]|nr:YitT family protein [Paracoccus sp. (in: a-proteobacteria)]